MKLAIVFLICIGFSQFALAEMIDNQDGTVTDTNTNLMWQKYSSESLSRSQATIHIEQLNWGDYSNWRYPTNTELFGVFTSTSGCYWYNSDDQGICFTSYGFEYAFTQTGKVFAVRNIEEEPEPITYTQEELDQAVLQERLKWDAIGDNKIGLPEAIKALQVLSGSIEQTQSVEWNIERITSNSDWDNNPSLYDGNIAWSKQDAPRGLRYFDGNDISELNSGLANLGNKPSLHNGSIAFAGWKTSTGSSQVYLYDGNSVSQISNSTVRVLYSSLHSNQVAWAEFVGGTDNSNTEIIFYDGSSIRQLTDNNVKDVAPSLYNGQIAWSSFDGNDDEILFFDGTTTHQITDNNYNDSAPSLYDGKIAWQGDIEGWQIFFYDGSVIQQITDNEASNGAPSLFGNTIAWHGGGEIFYFDGTKTHLVGSGEWPSLYGNQIAYAKDKEIYLATPTP